MIEAAALERANISDARLVRTAAFVDGTWRAESAAPPIEVLDPFTGNRIASVPSMSAAEVEAAVTAAARAFGLWSRAPARERSAFLRRWLGLIEANREDLARLITLENGKPLKEARGEIDYGAGFIDFYADEATRILGEVIPPNLPGRRLSAEREPVGVCAAITPWNFPMAMLTRKIAPALAAGCTIVAKPASETPLSALALAWLAEQAGLPAGVLNMVTGDPPMIGQVFTASEMVRKISFTGSTAVGARLMAASGATIKRLSLELGGNAPLLVFDDADLETAVETAMVAKFRNGGQSCIAANRILVQSGIHDRFAQAFAARVQALATGDGFAEGTDIGPLIHERAVAKVRQHLDEAMRGGARLLAGGGEANGTLFPPTLIGDVSPEALLMREETFGPLAALVRFDSVDEGLAIANATPFGLAAYVCSADPRTIARASRELESGMVGINTGLISTAVAPFGGVKLSGLGREGSRHGLDEYLNIKYVCQAGL